jgi:putative ABC transport system substrate-binding protein
MKSSATVLSVILALALLAAPVPSDAQQPGKVYRIGYLGGSSYGYDLDAKNCPMTGHPNWQALVAGLRERGYIRDRNLVIECRWTESREERARAFAAELVSLKPDLLVAFSTPNVRGAKQATTTLPIVMVIVIDPVGRGLVPSLARPGGNVTGLTGAPLEMEGKRLQLLKEAIPTLSRVAVLGYSGGTTPEPAFRREREDAGRAVGVTVQVYGVREPTEFTGTFAAMTKWQAEALSLESHPFLNLHIRRLVDLAAQSRLPAMYYDREFVTAGGLMAYGADFSDIWRRVGSYVDRILKGANPGDLPVEQPTKYDLFINGKTAKALGLTIPPSLLMRAEVIQ